MQKPQNQCIFYIQINYYQWYNNIPSAEVINKVLLDYLKKAYPGLHDLDLELAVKKVS